MQRAALAWQHRPMYRLVNERVLKTQALAALFARQYQQSEIDQSSSGLRNVSVLREQLAQQPQRKFATEYRSTLNDWPQRRKTIKTRFDQRLQQRDIGGLAAVSVVASLCSHGRLFDGRERQFLEEQ